MNHNATLALDDMPLWAYFTKPSNMAYHDLTTTTRPPDNLRALLGLGQKFIPRPSHTPSWTSISKSRDRLERDLWLRAYFGDEPFNTDNFNKRMYLRSTWTPPDWTFPRTIYRRLQNFFNKLQPHFTKRPTASNLLKHQRIALKTIRTSATHMVINCDKNLGPAIIEKNAYIDLCFRDHLSDTTTYQYVPPENIEHEVNRLVHLVNLWMKTHKANISKLEKKYLDDCVKRQDNPFPFFYALAKVHKQPLKTRPIVSVSGSLLQGIALWADCKLQPIAKKGRAYFRDSFTLKQELDKLVIPEGALLFTADATSMYTNIPTQRALLFIRRHLRKPSLEMSPSVVTAICDALRLVMTNNVFQFGDTHWKQLTGTAMGTPPAPSYANIYYSIHEDDLLMEFDQYLLLYRWFIDDVLGIWLPHGNQATWQSFKDRMNSDTFGLTWEHSPLQSKVNFMDLTIEIKGNKLITTLYDKPSNLHLYIPPSSCHPPGTISGLIHGHIHRIQNLCSSSLDQETCLHKFIVQLQ